MVATKNQQLGTGVELLAFGEYQIDLVRRVLLREGTRVRIQKKPLDVLIYLVQAAPRMVPREELLDEFWSRAVSEEVLTRCISTIRKRLRDNEGPPRFVETYRAEGYRFVCAVNPTQPTDTADTNRKTSLGRVAAAGIVAVALATVAALLWRGEESQLPNIERVERIAVLPVQAPDAEPEWLKPALSDHLVRAISRIEGVTVVTSNTDADNLDIKSHGEDLGVEALLLTQLQQSPSGSTLLARLLAVNDGSLLWSAAVDSDSQFSSGDQVQQVSRQLATRLRPTLQLGERKPEVDQRAYSYYLQGRYHWAQRSAIGLEAAIASYAAALAVEPGYKDALLGSAESWLLMPLYGAMAPSEAIPTARQFAERALEMDPLSSRGRAVLGSIIKQYDWDWVRAESLLREAVSLNPNNATAQQWLGELFCLTERFDDCVRHLGIAYDLDPLSPVLRMMQGSPALFSGDFETALAVYSDATQVAPEYPLGRYVIGLAYSGLDDWEQAVTAYRASLPDLGVAIVGGPLIHALSRAGEEQEARELLAELEALAATRYVPPTKLAVAYIGLGDKDRALAELWRAVEARDDRLMYFTTDAHFSDVIDEPGFQEIVKRIRLD